MDIPIAVAEVVSQSSSTASYSACSSSTFVESSHVLEERKTKEFREKERLIVSLNEEKVKLKEQYLEILEADFFEE